MGVGEEGGGGGGRGGEVRNVSPWDYERMAGRDGKRVCERHRNLFASSTRAV